MGMAGIRAGVELSERPGIPYADPMTQLYYVLGLFVFGGLDLGVPTLPAGRASMETSRQASNSRPSSSRTRR